MLCLIVKLKSNNAGIVLYHFHQLTDDTLAVKTVSVMCDIHNLTRTVWTSPTLICHHDIWILFCHPSWYCICWCSDNNMNFFTFTSIQHLCDMRKIKHSVFRLFCAPCRLCNPDYIDACLFHHSKILVKPFIRHILIIICTSI